MNSSNLRSKEKNIPNKADGQNASHQFAFHLAQTLNESDRVSYYKKLLDTYPNDLVRKALVDCDKVPGHRIKKNRAALFKSILNRYANNPPSQSTD